MLTSRVTWNWPAGTLASVHPIVGQFDLFYLRDVSNMFTNENKR